MKVIEIAVFLCLALAGTVLAKGECFCLADEDDNFRHSCETQQQSIRQITHCRDDAGEPYRLDDLSGWTKLADGEGRCSPCTQLKAEPEGPIRGNGDNPPATDPADEPAE